MLIDRMEEKDGPMNVIGIPDGFVETCYMLTGHIKRLKKADDEDIYEGNIHSIKCKDSEYFREYVINDTE